MSMESNLTLKMALESIKLFNVGTEAAQQISLTEKAQVLLYFVELADIESLPAINETLEN
jgi:hypothetical protein